MLKVATAFSGIGAFEQALLRLDIPHEILFACDNGNRIINIDYDLEFEKVRALKSPQEKKEYVDRLYNTHSRQINFVKQSYIANYDIAEDRFYQDVKLLDGTDFRNVDIFVGGSPCQSFSMVGTRGGFEDTRGTLFYEFVRLVKEMQPKVFVYENVYGVLTHDKGKTWETMQNVFSELGYHFKWKILDARDFGIPQATPP